MTAGGGPDPRLNAFRPDLADSRLRGKVPAARFVDGAARRVVAASAPLRKAPRPSAPLNSELLHGETVRVFDDAADGWSWVQTDYDGYVGYVPPGTLGPPGPAPTHRVSALRTFVYPEADMKLPAVAALTMGSLLVLGPATETRGTLFRRLAEGDGAVVAVHVRPLAADEPDFAATAESFLRVPYLWGGRTSLGLDCSALVQVALMMAGRSAPRDTDMQAAELGEPLARGIDGPLRRGDLVFWPGHVGIMLDPARLLHASGRHMAVVVETLAEAAGRIGPPSALRRLGPAEA